MKKHNKQKQGGLMHPIEVSDTSFQREVLESPQLTVVDFWAPWCGPCRIIAPVVEQLAQEYAGRVKFVKVNTDENFATASSYGISGIPTLLFFKDGKPVDSVVGAVPKSILKEKLDKLAGPVRSN
ncbi:MAG: thioredoxin [Bacteroidota bacterium]|nr:thioredoxin [Bacteroidota bacterium]